MGKVELCKVKEKFRLGLVFTMQVTSPKRFSGMANMQPAQHNSYACCLLGPKFIF